MAKGRITFENEKCKGCLLCVHYCPTKILLQDSEINNKGYNLIKVSDLNKCLGCGICALVCPDSVIACYQVLS